ncbi:MAG: tRNA (adenosine(37)-N6)-dimethylallyltransferase MiaA [Hyphomicrobiales bacterium]|nr:tRNA (adenosine(37)-N6)-dimethylallyltransferase MiaA [Hyphomicrobiales bacterium]
MQSSAERAVLIAGPTASGKSALALALAEQIGGTIINADAMQVYRDLRIITARPSAQDEAGVAHALYGHVDAAENYSVGRWVVDVAAALAAVRKAGRVPIVVGGTGLYFKVLTQGLAAVPPIPAEIRSSVRARLAAAGPAALHIELQRLDPVTAGHLMPGDRARIGRALEVVEATGRSLSEWHRQGMAPVLAPAAAFSMFLEVERATLYGRIDTRFDAMLAAGACEEVAALGRRGLDPSLPAMKAHGVPALLRHLRGEISLETAAVDGKRDTRRYTKRQETWFRHQLPDWTWAAPDKALDAILRALDR